MLILGVPMILRQIERVRRAVLIDELIVATSTDLTDDPLANLCAEAGIAVFRGSLDDVLDRFYHAAARSSPAYVVRLTGDCPLIDPEVIDLVIRACQSRNCDYASNAVEPTYPDGLDVEVIRFPALARAWKEARLTSEREHVTPYVYRHPESFTVCHVRGATDLSHHRWTVDNAEDFELVTRIYEALYPHNPAFSTTDILELLKANPDWCRINRHIERNEGMRKSLLADQQSVKVIEK